MGDMMVRNIPDEIHDGLRERAYQNNRSVEAEVRSLITSAILSGSGDGLGDHLRKRFKSVKGEELSNLRAKTPTTSDVDE